MILCFPCVKWTAEVETIDADGFNFFVSYHYYIANQILSNLAFFFLFYCVFFLFLKYE